MKKNKLGLIISLLIIIIFIILVSKNLLFFGNKNIKPVQNIDEVKLKEEKLEEINLEEINLEEDEEILDEKISNSDVIGRIAIDGTSIDTVLVQSNDNDYYLSHNIDKQKDIYGSIFMDYRNTYQDRKLLIYGHNSKKKKAVFSDLEKFVNESFYKDNKYIHLTLNNERTDWIIFSIMIIENTSNKHMKISFNDTQFEKHIKWLKDNSIYNTYVDVDISDRILLLQTCYYNPNNSYLIISAKEI